MLRALVLAVLAAGCGRVGFDATGADASVAQLTLRHPITVMGPSPALADFPVGIVLAGDTALVGHARPDGRDLAFTAADGTTVLPFEIESYDGATGALVAWVRVPSLGPATRLYLYFGGPSLDLADPPLVWPGCRGVWHLGDRGGAHDSTSHAHTFDAPSAAQEPATVAGIAGGARGFDGMTSTLAIPDPADGSLDMGTGSFSLSLWVDVAMPADQYDEVLYKGGGSMLSAGYDVEIGTQVWRTDGGDGTHNTYAMFGGESMFQGSWTHLVGVADRSAQQLDAYANGVLANTTSLSTIGSVDSSRPLEMSGAMYPFRGVVDELRIYDHALSPAWIAAEYQNLTDPTFVQLGPAEQAP